MFKFKNTIREVFHTCVCGRYTCAWLWTCAYVFETSLFEIEKYAIKWMYLFSEGPFERYTTFHELEWLSSSEGCVFVCMYVCNSVCIYLYECACESHVCVCECVYVFIYFAFVCLCTCMCILWACIYECMLCVYVLYGYTYVYVLVWV